MNARTAKLIRRYCRRHNLPNHAARRIRRAYSRCAGWPVRAFGRQCLAQGIKPEAILYVLSLPVINK